MNMYIQDTYLYYFRVFIIPSLMEDKSATSFAKTAYTCRGLLTLGLGIP